MLKWEVLPTADMRSQDFNDMIPKMAEIFRGPWRSASGTFRKENRRAYVRRRSEASDNSFQHIYDVRKQVCNSGWGSFYLFSVDFRYPFPLQIAACKVVEDRAIEALNETFAQTPAPPIPAFYITKGHQTFNEQFKIGHYNYWLDADSLSLGPAEDAAHHKLPERVREFYRWHKGLHGADTREGGSKVAPAIAQVCQQGAGDAEIGTLGPMARIKLKIKDSSFASKGARRADIGTLGPVARIRLKIKTSWYASRTQGVQKLGPSDMWHTSN